MERSHLLRVAQIHHAELSDDFLPSLGKAFLAKGFYKSCLDNPFAETLVAKRKDGQIAGFALAAKDPSQYLGRIIKSSIPQLIIAGVSLAARNPKRLFEAVAIMSSKAPKFEMAGEIAVIAVDSTMQRAGVGSKLVDSVNALFASAGLRHAYTKTLATNDHVIRMYKKWGGEVVERIKILDKQYVYILWDIS